MVPQTYPVFRNPWFGTSEMTVYELPSIVGLVRWTDYIPVKYVSTVTSSESEYDTDGYITIKEITSITNLASFTDYIPVYVDAGATVPWEVSGSGYIPIGLSGGGSIAMALNFLNHEALDSRITFTRADVTRCATRFNEYGQLELVPANVPRLDYDPVTLAPRGLLIEESRHNLFLNSLFNGTSLSTQSITVTAAPWTISFYGTGSITLSGASTGTITGLGASTRVTSTFTPSAGSLTCTVSGQVYWAQAELGSFATSFIPTSGTAVTRAADVATMTGTNFSSWYNATEGTFIAEWFQDNAPASGVNNGILEVRGASFNDSMSVFVASGLVPVLNVNVGGANQVALNSAAGSLTDIQRHAASYKANDFATSFNGAAVVTDVAGTIPTVTSMIIGNIASGQYCNNWIRRITYYSTALTDAQLQSLTAR